MCSSWRTFSNKRVFKRTNTDFINWVDPNYRLRNTILINIPGLNFVHSIVLDVMHLVFLGFMRTMLITWNDRDLPFKLSRQMIQRISNSLISQRLPVEFTRKPRELKYLLRWKVTEYRSFLLYLGPIVLKGVIDQEKYDNFMTLHVALFILLNPKCIRDEMLRSYVRSLLNHFVKTFMDIYSESFIIHNFHNLIHLVDDADYFSTIITDNEFNLDIISAFRFENYLQKIKTMVRGKNKSLEQIENRMTELFFITNSTFSSNLSNITQYPICSQNHNNGPLQPNCINPQYKTLDLKHFKINIYPPNNCCVTKSGDIIFVENICCLKNSNEYIIVGRKFLRRKDFYSIPCKSLSLGIYKVETMSDIKTWSANDIVLKYVSFSYKR